MISRNPEPSSQCMRVKDFVEANGVDLQSSDNRLSTDDILIEGDFLHEELRRGLFIHVGNVRERCPFTVRSTIDEGLACIFFLDGQVDVSLGDREFSFGSERSTSLEGMGIMNAHPETFKRVSQGPQQVRHLVVSATAEWLDECGLSAVQNTFASRGLAKQHLHHHRWCLSQRLVDLVQQASRPSTFAPDLRNLYLEGRAVEIVAETISHMMNVERQVDSSSVLTHRDFVCLQRAEDMIARALTSPLCVETIARESGMSASSLQRLFRVAKGVSVFEYVRRCRLALAKEALASGQVSLRDASITAGYANPSNFATAFKREFGMTPRAAKRPL